MANFKHSRCYFCGKPSSSREHAPPKMLFKGFGCDKITAPSCPEHNYSKSNYDQAFVSALVQSIESLQNAHCIELTPDIELSISTMKSSFESTKKMVKKTHILVNGKDTGKIHPDLIYLHGNPEFWIKQMTAVLVWDAIGDFDNSINWNEAIVRSNTWVPSINTEGLELDCFLGYISSFQKIKRMDQNLNWQKGWSARPQPYPYSIYQFSLLLDLTENIVILKHEFFNALRWYILFNPSTQTKKAISLFATRHSNMDSN